MRREVKMIRYYDPKIDLTLLGCGFLGAYHVGAISLLTQVWPDKPYNRICGASCGGLLAALVVAGVGLENSLKYAVDVLCVLRSFLSEPRKIIPMYDLVEKTLNKLLPWNAHELCSDKLGVSVTKLWPFENVIISKFRSRSDLIDAVCAGCFIPMWSGSLVGPKFRGKIHLDGAYTNNMPKFDPEPDLTQVTVCPFAGDIDVSPKDVQNWGQMCVFGTRFIFNWNNFTRSTHAMFPMRLSTYRQYLIQGHSDMKDYVLENDLIKCQSCYLVKEHSTSRNEAERRRPHTACLGCLMILERVDSLSCPDNLLRQFDDDRVSRNKLVASNKLISPVS